MTSFKDLQFFLFISLALLFIIYGIYTIITNVIVSLSYENSVGNTIIDDSLQTYLFPQSISTGSKLLLKFSPKAATYLVIQFWITVFAVLLFPIGLCMVKLFS